MADNKFLIFDENNSNIYDDLTYQSNTERIQGLQAGTVARSLLHNKIFRQTTMMSNAFGEIIKANGLDATDSNPTVLLSNLRDSLQSLTSAQTATYDPTGNTYITATNVQQALDQVDQTFIDISQVDPNAELLATHYSSVKNETYNSLNDRLNQIEKESPKTYSAMEYNFSNDGATDNASTLTQFITTIGSDLVELIFEKNTYFFTTSTFPSNINLKFTNNAKLKIATSNTLTINGEIYANANQIFVGDTFVLNKQRELKPEWFGAIGDGATDDTIALNKCIANKITNKVATIKFSNKTYCCEYLTILGDVILEGTEDTTIKCIYATYRTSFLNCTTNGNVTIKNIKIDANRKAFRGININQGLENFTIINVKVSNCYDSAQLQMVAGIYIYGNTKNIYISKCKFFDIEATPNGIVGDNGGVARGILTEPNIGESLTKDVSILDCTFENIKPREDGDGIQITGGLNDDTTVTNVMIARCKFYKCWKRAIKIQAPGVTVRDCEIYNDFDGVLPDWSDGMYAAISIYASNSKVLNNYIHGKSYEAPIDVGSVYTVKNVEISGNYISVGEGGTVIPTLGVIRLNAILENFTIDNNIIKGGKIGVYLRRNAKNITISNNIITGVTYYGVWVDSFAYENISSIIINNNTINSTRYAILISAGTQTVVACNVLTCPGWEGIYGEGAYVKSGNIGNYVDGTFASLKATLPSAINVGRGNILLKENAGADDTLHICIKKADNTYAFKTITLT